LITRNNKKSAPAAAETQQQTATVTDPLLDFVADLSGTEFLQVEEDLGAGFVRLNTAEAERRQARHDIRHAEDIIIELLRNSRDAGARHIFIATSKEDNLRDITVIDDGIGVPQQLQQLIFEPRVTSKLTSILEDEWGVHGRGMALYSIAQNVNDVAICASGTGRGTALQLCIDTTTLPERADQSSWPKVEQDQDGRLHCVSGPHNLLRHIAQFALTYPKLKLYIGSACEILATLKAYGRAQDKAQKTAGESDQKSPTNASSDPSLDDTPHCLLPAQAADAALLAHCAAGLGLEISTRSAYRIDNNEVAPLTDVATMLAARVPRDSAELDLSADMRGLKIDRQDLQQFSQSVERAFDTLSEKYYITASAEPKVSLKKNSLSIRLDFEKEY